MFSTPQSEEDTFCEVCGWRSRRLRDVRYYGAVCGWTRRFHFLVKMLKFAIVLCAFALHIRALQSPCETVYMTDVQLAGAANGSNTIFDLPNSLGPKSNIVVYRNGLKLTVFNDYTIVGNRITFLTGAVPAQGDSINGSFIVDCPGAHALIGPQHAGIEQGNVKRGDILVGKGLVPVLGLLGLGPNGSCLVSNGSDPVWGACTGTAFPVGSIPFTNQTGSLAGNPNSLFWNSTDNRLGLGTGNPSANLTIQASASQGSTDLTRWVNSAGSTLASLSSSGTLLVQKMNVSTNSQFAALNDSGFGADPALPLSGDFWFNNSQRSRKTFEAGQVHPIPQVLCSVGGGTTNSTTNATVGSCSIPQSFFDSGDRIEISLNFEHSGSASAFVTEIFIGSTSVFNRQFASADTFAFIKGSGGYYPTGVAFSSYSFGTAGSAAGSPMAGLSSNVTLTPTTAAQITFRARLVTASSDIVALRNYTVVRFPAQFNP